MTNIDNSSFRINTSFRICMLIGIYSKRFHIIDRTFNMVMTLNYNSPLYNIHRYLSLLITTFNYHNN